MESKTLGIYPLTLQMLSSQDFLEREVYPFVEKEYYWSRDSSAAFYIAQAKAGFIAVSEVIEGEELLLPEIQRSYAVLDFESVHTSRKVAAILRNHTLSLEITTDLNEAAEQIARYHRHNWFSARYHKILQSTVDVDPQFQPYAVLLKDAGRSIAGEIGYVVGRTYTSLTGFSSKERRYRDWGKVQMVLLAQRLAQEGFAFWNLGHPYMPYKTALGARVHTRSAFLERWYQAALGREFSSCG